MSSSSSNFTSDAVLQDRGVDTEMQVFTLRPQLYVVPLGSYATAGGNYGSGVAATGNYDLQTLQNGTTTKSLVGPSFVTAETQGRVRRNRGARDVDVDIAITLDANTLLALPAAGELRIRCKPLAPSEPSRWARGFPLPDSNSPFAPVLDVIFFDKNNIPLTAANIVASGVGIQSANKARLLHDGSIVLFGQNLINGGLPTFVDGALLSAPLSAALSSGIGANQVVKILVRGSYTCGL